VKPGWLAAEAAPSGPLVLRALDAPSEPDGSRTSPMGRWPPSPPARASRPQAQRTAALLVIFVRKWQALTHWRCTDATLRGGWRHIDASGCEKPGRCA